MSLGHLTAGKRLGHDRTVVTCMHGGVTRTHQRLSAFAPYDNVYPFVNMHAKGGATYATHSQYYQAILAKKCAPWMPLPLSPIHIPTASSSPNHSIHLSTSYAWDINAIAALAVLKKFRMLNNIEAIHEGYIWHNVCCFGVPRICVFIKIMLTTRGRTCLAV